MAKKKKQELTGFNFSINTDTEVGVVNQEIDYSDVPFATLDADEITVLANAITYHLNDSADKFNHISINLSKRKI